MRAVFCLAFLGTYVFISDRGVGGGRWGEGCIFSSPWGSWGSRVGSFLLCFVYPPWPPLQPGTYVDGLVRVLLGFSEEAVWVHLITWMTLVPLITFSHFFHQYVGCPREGLRGYEGGAWWRLRRVHGLWLVGRGIDLMVSAGFVWDWFGGWLGYGLRGGGDCLG